MSKNNNPKQPTQQPVPTVEATAPATMRQPEIGEIKIPVNFSNAAVVVGTPPPVDTKLDDTQHPDGPQPNQPVALMSAEAQAMADRMSEYPYPLNDASNGWLQVDVSADTACARIAELAHEQLTQGGVNVYTFNPVAYPEVTSVLYATRTARGIELYIRAKHNEGLIKAVAAAENLRAEKARGLAQAQAESQALAQGDRIPE